jgi:hypothetical protein
MLTRQGKRGGDDRDDKEGNSKEDTQGGEKSGKVSKVERIDLNYEMNDKPRGLGVVDNTQLIQLINALNLVKKPQRWTRNEKHAVCNLIQGHTLYFAFGSPNSNVLSQFHNRMTEEVQSDRYFQQITDPMLLFVKTLPDQPANGNPPPVPPAAATASFGRFHYPTWANIQRPTDPLGVIGISTNVNNAPLEWYDANDPTCLLDRAIESMLTDPPEGVPASLY